MNCVLVPVNGVDLDCNDLVLRRVIAQPSLKKGDLRNRNAPTRSHLGYPVQAGQRRVLRDVMTGKARSRLLLAEASVLGRGAVNRLARHDSGTV